MIMETHYYLINGKVMKGGEMPKINQRDLLLVPSIDINDFEKIYSNWLNSLQPCEISESELDEINTEIRIRFRENNIKGFLSQYLSNTIEITDIVEEKDGKIYFKQLQAKIDELTAQFEQSDKMYCELLAKKDDFKRMFSEAMEQNQQLQAKIDELEKENENLLLNIKSLSHK